VFAQFKADFFRTLPVALFIACLLVTSAIAKDYDCNLKFPIRDNFTTCELKNVRFNGRDKIKVNFNETALLEAVEDQPQLNFVKQVRFISSKLDGIPNAVFETFAELKVLDASNVNVHYINSLTFVFATSLEQLFLYSNRLTRLNAYCYVHTKNLLVLDLSDNIIASVSSQAFTSLEKLETLSLANNRIDVLDDLVFRPLKSLQWLWLDRNRLNLISSDLFTHVNANLEGIYLNSNRIDMISPFVFDHLASLRFLMLDANNCVDRGFKNHHIKENSSIKMELRRCFRAFLKSVDGDAAKHNVSLALTQTNDEIKECQENSDDIKTEIDSIQSQLLEE
jgi:Leucine-rich repeat (LRR) protein